MAVIYYLYSPENNNLFPKCPFKGISGLDCPGCGSQRAIHELLHFNLKKAFGYNPLLVVSIPYILAGIAFNFDGIKKKFPKTRNFLFGKVATYIVLGIVVSFFVLRNF